jgi:hypothetical protein
MHSSDTGVAVKFCKLDPMQFPHFYMRNLIQMDKNVCRIKEEILTSQEVSVDVVIGLLDKVKR